MCAMASHGKEWDYIVKGFTLRKLYFLQMSAVIFWWISLCSLAICLYVHLKILLVEDCGSEFTDCPSSSFENNVQSHFLIPAINGCPKFNCYPPNQATRDGSEPLHDGSSPFCKKSSLHIQMYMYHHANLIIIYLENKLWKFSAYI